MLHCAFSPTMADSSNGGQPLFTPISHPELRQLGHEHIHPFLRDRETYLLRVQDVDNSSGHLEPVSVKVSLDGYFIASLIELEEFRSAVA